jgi:4-oxalomesaconate hydratase
MLVIGAHSADFVWRAGGAIAVTTAGGGAASVIALSYGERGESGELWKQEGQTIDGDALRLIADRIREFAPDVLITHTDTDPFNPDHPIACAAVGRARGLAAGAGVKSAFATVTPPELFLFEPHQPELCNFTPTTFVDITSVMERKLAAMGEMKAQKYLVSYYAERAGHRGNHARRSSGNHDIRQAEAFQRVTPQVVSAL